MAFTTSFTSSEFELSIPPSIPVKSKDELTVLRAAFARQPHSTKLRNRLASLLLGEDAVDEAIAILRASKGSDLSGLLLLQSALLSRCAEPENLEARQLGERAVALDVSPALHAKALALFAKAHIRLGNEPAAVRLLERALVANIHNKDAYKRLFAIYLQRDPEQALAFTKTMKTAGVRHTTSLASVKVALAKLGRLQEAWEQEGFERFFQERRPDPPPGWPTLHAFCDAVTKELVTHPELRYLGSYGTAARKSWRVEEQALRRSPLAPQFANLIRDEVLQIVAAKQAKDHPFLQARPAKAVLNSWAVITEGQGYEEWHRHDYGWLSGVFYLHVQDHIENGAGSEGCIAFGLPASVIGEQAAAAFGERLVRPRTGSLITFPSSMYHRTFPHAGTGRRVAIGFDIVPESRG